MNKFNFRYTLIVVLVIASLILPGSNRTSAMPMSPVDESQVPHYFGPNPNWANSPFTLPAAQVTIIGDGAGATAEATIGVGGVITAINVTSPGAGYSKADVLIEPILGSTGSGAEAIANIIKRGAVVAIQVDAAGTGYTAPSVTIDGSGGATATAYGGVESVVLLNPGSGYTMPTVDFDMPDDPDGIQAQGVALWDQLTGDVWGVTVTDPGSGYLTAPGVEILNGTIFAPLPLNEGGQPATGASTTLFIDSIVVENTGADYKTPPAVLISDPTGTGAQATAMLDNGVIESIDLKKGGSGYLSPGGIRKFVDKLPGLGPTAANNLGQYIPIAVPDTTTFPDDPNTPENEGADYYEIAVVEYMEQMHTDLPPTKLRGYVQLATSVVTGAVPLTYLDGSPINLPTGAPAIAVDEPHYLGPAIVAAKDRAVRITFFNLLPTGAGGDLFIPTDSTIMGSGMGPMEGMAMEVMDDGLVTDMVRNPVCSDKDPVTGAKPFDCFKDNRATLHLHGGNSPWISDGTPHQWITPANEATQWPQGVSVVDVPDMIGQAAIDAGVPDCSVLNGCMTFYYTNQQSARLMFYHDHSWGITRLNVYAGEAAPYIITDETEQALIANGAIPSDVIPLVIQDRTFVPQDAQLYNQYDPITGELLSYGQDPTWDASRWGGYGNLWYHHVYMPAQNPGAPGGMSAFGRWMYSPWFWPPQNAKYPPIANPYYNMDPKGPDGLLGTMDDWTSPLAVACNLDNPATWQYQEDPFCEPQLIPSVPLISAGMEQFNDTPVVNGTAYPTVTLEPKAYRLRILNAANDRFWNLQWYVGDPTTASTDLNADGQPIGATEVALNAAEVAAAQLDPVVFPTPDLALSPAGPDWIQFGNEGGFLPAPVVVDGQQVTTWIEDPTRFDAGLVDQHSLLLAPAERADVVVDFSKFAGQTLILYNDAPAAFPARIPSYDYYTGAPDLRPVGAPQILPGYGPNTRTIMQVKIAGAAAPAFNLTKLQSAFSHKANGSGVFEAGQPPVIVGQSAYNSAYGSRFAASGWCNAPTNPSAKCDGFARISEQGGDMFKFDTLSGNQVSVKIEPKAIQDETSESNFDEFGRMTAVLGVEVVPATPGLANTVLYGYSFPLVDVFDTSGLPRADVKISPISSGDDGTQIWKITHNGVDTHPIHFHAMDVQVLNRVTWDNIIKPPDPAELGWKETVRVSPLEDTYVAMRPIIPVLPFDFPNSVRMLSPMMPEGAMIADTTAAEALGLPIVGFAPNGEPIDISNHLVNYGAEYVYHCHILSHEEMDMMHAVSLTYPPVAPSGLQFLDNGNGTGTLSWMDNSLSETAFVVEKSTDGGVSWVELGRVERLLTSPAGTGETLFLVDPSFVSGDQYRVVALNTVGDTWDYSNPALNEIAPGSFAFPVMTVMSEYSNIVVVDAAPLAPSNLAAVQGAGLQVDLTWTDNASNEDSYLVQRSENGVDFADLATLGADSVAFSDLTAVVGPIYTYQVAAVNVAGRSFSNQVSLTLTEPPAPPLAPSGLVATPVEAGPQVDLLWVDNATDETSYVVQRSINGGAFNDLVTLGIDTTSYTDLAVSLGGSYTYQVAAVNAGGSSFSSPASATLPAPPPPAAPSELVGTLEDGPQVDLAWKDNSLDETSYVVQRSTDGVIFSDLVTLGADSIGYVDTQVLGGFTYYYQVAAENLGGRSFSGVISIIVPDFLTVPAAPSNLAVSNLAQTSLTLSWADNSNNEQGFTVQRSTKSDFSRNLVTFNLGPNVTFYNDTGLSNNTKFFYRVSAFNLAGASTWSATLNVTTLK